MTRGQVGGETIILTNRGPKFALSTFSLKHNGVSVMALYTGLGTALGMRTSELSYSSSPIRVRVRRNLG